MFSINDKTIRDIANKTLPSFQNIDAATLNIGFGYIYYGLVRTLRPKNIVVIGSKAGFSPIMFGLGVKDNEGYGIGKIRCYHTETVCKEFGKVFFVDPSYSIDRNDPNHWYGIGTWDEPEKVKELWNSFDIGDVISHYKMTSEEFFNDVNCPQKIDMIYIDGDHSYDGIKNDIELYSKKMDCNGIILAHDVDPQIRELIPDAGGDLAINDLSEDLYEKLRLPIFPGLVLIRKKIM